MFRFFNLISAAVALIVAASLASAQAAPGPPLSATPVGPLLSPAQTEAFVDGAVGDAMSADHVAGVTVSIVQDGHVVLAKGYGAASFTPWRPVTADTLFHLGSTSKTFTWIALMREVEKGRVRLDAPVNDYLPPEARFPDQGFRQPIRVRDLMSHSAGLEDLALGHMWQGDPRKMKSLARHVATERPGRVREPGRFASYCNYCAVVGGDIVARVEGADFETVVERDITGPLDMTSTSFRDVRPTVPGLPAPMPAALAARTSDGFLWKGGDHVRVPVELLGQVAPAGGAWSSANDMARYMTMQLGDGRYDATTIYGPMVAAAFRTPILKTAPGINGWAHGFMILPLAGGRTGYGHDGDTTVFHTNMIVVPELGLGIFVSTNTDGGEELANRLPGLLVEHFYGAGPPPAALTQIGQKAIAPYAGAYLGTRRAAHGLEGFIGLLKVSSVSAGPGGLAAGGATWVPDGPAGEFREKNGVRRLTFDFESGKPVRWRTSANRFQNARPRWWERAELLFGAMGLSVLAAIAVLAGLIVRSRKLAHSPAQSAAGFVQAAASIAWLTSLAGLVVWITTATDDHSVLSGWPGPFITTFAWAAAVGAILSLAGVGLLAPVWRGAGWSRGRKLRYATTTAVFLLLAVVLFSRGGLDVWSL